MKLSQYLSENKLSDADFAELIGVDRSTVTRLRGDQIPKKPVMQAIFEKTGGAVTANDFFEVAA